MADDLDKGQKRPQKIQQANEKSNDTTSGIDDTYTDDAISVHPSANDLISLAPSNINVIGRIEDWNDEEDGAVGGFDANLTIIDRPPGQFVRVPQLSFTEMPTKPTTAAEQKSKSAPVTQVTEKQSVTRVAASTGATSKQIMSDSRSNTSNIPQLENTVNSRSDDRTMYMAGLSRQWRNSQNVEFETLPRYAIEAQLGIAECYWNRFMDAHKAAFQNAPSAKEQDECAELQFEIETLYINVVSRLRQRINELAFRENPAQFVNNDPAAVRFNNSMLRNRNEDLGIERMQVNKFGGNYKTWPSFKSMFETYFHRNTGMADHTKMFRLMGCLEPNSEAYNLVVGLDMRGENYASAWATLCDFYDDERKILDEMINEFLDIPRITRPDRASLVNLKIKTQNLLEAMPKYKINTSSWGVWLVPLLVRKLDYHSLALWASQRPKKSQPAIGPLLEFITTRSESIDDEMRAKREHWRDNKSGNRSNNNSQSEGRSNNNSSSQNANTRNTNASNANASDANAHKLTNRERKKKCPDPLCRENNNHTLPWCPRFKSLELDGRKRKVSADGVCELCLRKECEPSKCHMSPCRNCDELHNSYLCPVRKIDPVPMPKSVTTPLVALLSHGQAPANGLTNASHKDSENQIESASAAPMLSDGENATLLATAIVTINDRDGRPMQFRALCDQGAEVNLMTNDALQRLRLKRMTGASSVSGIGGLDIQLSGSVDALFKSRQDTGKSFALSALITNKITNRLPAMRLDRSRWPHLEQLTLADPHYDVPQEVDILLGASTYSKLVKPDITRGATGEPIGQATHIGWIVFGPTEANSKCLRALHSITNREECPGEARIDELLRKYWEIESVPQKHIRTREEKFCEEHFIRNTTRNAIGRYVVKLPINPEAGPLGNSRLVAQRRFLQLEQRFVRSPQLKENYVAFLNEYLSLGHMREAPPLPSQKQHFYIPHHAAGTKKFRVVFDGSSKTSNGTSLNDIQMTGEKLQPELTTTTMRFRTHKIALTADIKKMYRQVLIHPEQMDYQRILWRDDTSKPLREFQLTTQTYGLRSAPHNCIRALMQCAKDHEVEHPLAAMATHRDFYVDDFISGAHTTREAMNLFNDINTMLSEGGFELDKWATNSTEVHDMMGIDSASRIITLNSPEESENSVLGLRWASLSDTFKYNVDVPQQDEKVTKRKIVSYVARLYDPNGYVSAVAITAKIIIQKLWIAGVGWDAEVPENIFREWKTFITDLPRLSEVKIMRWIGTGGGCDTELHAFCDASNDAYGCAMYIKVTDETGNVKVNLVMSRTRVAPIKRMTVPRMELCGAHLLAKALDDVRAVHNVEPQNCHLWSDSMIVLHWLDKEPANAKTYVANRLAETGELTKYCTWRHVSTADNPADLASRGIPASEIVDNNLWWHGPDWLLTPQAEWPKTRIHLTSEHLQAIHGEYNPKVVMAATAHEPLLKNDAGDLLEQYSNHVKLYRVTAWVRRFINNAKSSKSDRIVGTITGEEFLRAENDWIKDMQSRHFAAEIECCKAGEAIPKKSKLLGLRPFIDANGVLRCSGRLGNAQLPFDNTHPIALSTESTLGKLIVRSAHKVTLHGGTQATMQYVRYKFWASKLRTFTRGIIHRCVKCTRHKGEPMTQMMGWLPRARVTPGRPFQQSGVDYCGPFTIKARGGRCKITTKGYVAVFICMRTRAVHLELVSDMTSEAFLAALARFTSRRGRVHELYSDNGTTFIGADKEHRAAVDSWKKVADHNMFDATLVTSWTFNPPAAPHRGGLWEAAVKSAKYHLRRVVGDQQLTFEEMATVLTKIEACLNSRPIGRITDDIIDNCALTPGHFLIGEPLVAPLTQDVSTTPDNRLRRWKLLEKFTQCFWQRWRDEYLAQMLSRPKWKVSERNAAVNDIVLVTSDNAPPTQWTLGKIVATYPGPDGLVRTVDVKFKKRIFRRPVSKLIRLPTDRDF